MPEVAVQTLLRSPSVAVRDIRCRGTCRHQSAEECAEATELVFPYRGVYARHLGRDQAIAEANQVVFFNRDEGYRISHPVAGGDACLSLALSEPLLAELAPTVLLRAPSGLAFRHHRLRIDPQAQAMVARLRQTLKARDAEPLEAESMALSLVAHVLGPRTARAAGGSFGRQRLADRVKLVLAGDPARRWTLAQVGAEVGMSPVYLTQVFTQVEGLSLYRYQLRLRLARALDLLDDYDDLTALGLDLGFSSHSHFSAAFRETYGGPPSAFRRGASR
ncbi:AraC family transcriptional regulator [Phenylobacterium sp.]|uniref:helix-turn-helix transcriptional regulator n=1 Tax=Phenylobacterium sp. TaxID=1871053 RepID=UPI00286C22D9|nr:AraC family transcriptional regulator [Phenylobacterium sp.]